MYLFQAVFSLLNRPSGVYSGEIDLNTGKPEGVGSFTPDCVDLPAYSGQWEAGFATTADSSTGGVLRFSNDCVVVEYSGGFQGDLPNGSGVIQVQNKLGFTLDIYEAYDF